MASTNWLPGDVILFRVRRSAPLRDRAVHEVIRAHQLLTDFNKRASAFGHVAIYAGHHKIWHATGGNGVHCSNVADEISKYELVAVRWTPEPSMAEPARLTMMRRVVHECADREKRRYAKTEVGRLALAAI
ncbi:MAG: hypothetical protein JNJ55_14295, partial [Betaproteobacteria bacterium]|nr:hypothetical protein [Betaproteobacteria bacterium]